MGSIGRVLHAAHRCVRPLLPAVLLLLAACTADTGREISFSTAIQPILDEKCVGCHFGGRAPFDMTRGDAHQDLMKGRYIVPGKAEASPLYVKVKGGHAAVAPLTSQQLKDLKMWIDQGAKRN